MQIWGAFGFRPMFTREFGDSYHRSMRKAMAPSFTPDTLRCCTALMGNSTFNTWSWRP